MILISECHTMGISDAIKMKSAQQWSSRQYCQVKYYMFNKFRRVREINVYIPIKQCSYLALQPIIYEIRGDEQRYCYLKRWPFLSWKENGQNTE